ncbi:unnamed protein product [Caenorhabditis brenneri]
MSKTLPFIILVLLATVSLAENPNCDPANFPDLISCMRTVYEMGLKAEILKNLKDIDGIFSKQCVELQNCYPILNCGDVKKREAADKVFNDIREESVTALNQTADSEIYKLCNKFPKCIPNLKCGSDKSMEAIVEKMEAFCEIIVAMISKEFADCDSKLLPENSICIKEWDPFPSLKNKNVEDREKMKKIQAEACKNFFGKDNCMEKEIKERCGVDMWPRLRKHYLAMNKLNDVCDFN